MSKPSYEYTQLKNLQIGKTVNVFGVVKYMKTAERTQGSDYSMFVSIVDKSVNEELKCVLFARDKQRLPTMIAVGDVVRFHRLQIKGYQDSLQGQGSVGRGFAALVFKGDIGDDLTPTSTSTTHTCTQNDLDQVIKLRAWVFDDDGDGSNQNDSTPHGNLSIVSSIQADVLRKQADVLDAEEEMLQRRDELENEEMSSQTGSEISTQSLREPGIFDGITAWFSDSVHREYICTWEHEDGERADVETAQLLFSADAESTDTTSLYDSEEYLYDSLAIYHPAYIDECLEVGNPADVQLAKFFLPSADVQKALRPRTRFHWETKRNTLQKQTVSNRTSQTTSVKNTVKTVSNMEDSTRTKNSSRKMSSKQKMKETRSQTITVEPSNEVQKRSQVSADISKSVRKMNNDRDSSSRCPSHQGNGDAIYRRMPVISLDAYIPVEDLVAYSGPLLEFTPNENGCSVSRLPI